MKHLLVPGGSTIGRRLAAHPYTLIGALLLLGFAAPFCLRQHSEWDEVYLRGALHLKAGAGLYGRGENYVYPPFMAWAALPFTVLPHLESRLVWYVISSISLVLLLRWSWKLSGGGALQGPAAVRPSEHWICLLGLAGSIYYSLDCLTNQKCDLIIGALMIGGCLAFSRSRSFLAATLFGVAAAMKCTPLLWAPYLAWRGRYRAAVWVLCVAVGVNLLPDLTNPAEGRSWAGEWCTRYLLPMGGSDYRPGEWASEIKNNQSLGGAANRFFLVDHGWSKAEGFRVWDRAAPINSGTYKGIVFGGELTLVLLALVVLNIGRRKGSAEGGTASLREPLEYSVVLLLMLLLSPMSSKTHYCVLFLPAFCVARLAVERGDRVLWALLLAAIALGLLSNKDLWGNTVYVYGLWYGSVTWSAGVLLLGCGYAIAGGRSSSPVSIANLRSQT